MASARPVTGAPQPGRIAVPQRLQPFPELPQGCLGLVEVGDPPGEVLVTGELGQVGVWPVPVLDALGEHGLVHALGPVAWTTVSHETDTPVAAPGPASPRRVDGRACGVACAR